MQVELDALPPEVLRTLYADALADVWDQAAYERAMRREGTDRRALTR